MVDEWVGIDGYGTPTVEQVGVEATCSEGSPTYQVWFESYPGPSTNLPGVVLHEGDVVYLEVELVAPAAVRYVATDRTTGATATTTEPSPGETGSTAECVLEDPTFAGGSTVPLAQFDPVQFDACTVNRQGIGSLPHQRVVLTGLAGEIRATPTGLSPTSGFFVRSHGSL
jgi:hypothetical protein